MLALYAGAMPHYAICMYLLLLLIPDFAQADIYMQKNDTEEIRLTNLEEQAADPANTYVLLVAEATTNQIKASASPAATSPTPALPFAASVSHAARLTSLEPALLHAVMHVESSGNRLAVSPKGARGLMQLMPATARRYGVTDSLDPTQNVLAAAQYLQWLKQQFHGDTSLMLAAYNAGPQAVIRHGYRVPPYAETQRYVPRVLRKYRQLQHSLAN